MTSYLQNIRKKIGNDMLQIATADWLIIQDDKLLLQERAGENIWGMIGGMIEPGETIVEAAVREAQEEAGLTIHSQELFGIYAGKEFQATYPNNDQVSPVKIVFITEDFSGTLQCDEEGESLQFFHISKLPLDIHHTHIPVINDYIAYKASKLNIPVVT